MRNGVTAFAFEPVGVPCHSAVAIRGTPHIAKIAPQAMAARATARRRLIGAPSGLRRLGSASLLRQLGLEPGHDRWLEIGVLVEHRNTVLGPWIDLDGCLRILGRFAGFLDAL